MRQQVRNCVKQWILLVVVCSPIVGFATSSYGTSSDNIDAFGVADEASMVCGFESDLLQMSIDGEDAPEPAALKVFCLKPEWGAPCSNRCIAKGVGCAPLHAHPWKTDAGWGRLAACNTLPIGYMCSFQFSNGEYCNVFFGTFFPTLCVHIGGA